MKSKIIISITIATICIIGVVFVAYKNYKISSINDITLFTQDNVGEKGESGGGVINIFDVRVVKSDKFINLKDVIVKYKETKIGKDNPFEIQTKGE